jgi:formate C-acetyltransferase
MPNRLSAITHDLARRALNGEHGRSTRNAAFTMDECGDLSGLSDEMRYASAVTLIAHRAPLRVLPEELVIGSATLAEAPHHMTPVWGKHSTSHTTVGFDRVLKIGYLGLRREIADRLRRGDLDERGKDLLRAMLVCLDAAAVWHRRHIALLDDRIRTSAGAARATAERVRDAARNVPENPPRTFREAVQSLWFMYAFQRLCGNWSGLGRVDMMLGPFLKADLSAGRIDLDEARELVAHFWIKGCEWIGAGSLFGGSGDAQFYQNVVLSGVDEQGDDATNDVTYVILDVVQELRISDFPIAVRISKRTPDRLLRRIAEVQRVGGGTVAVYNEDLILNALTRFGYPRQEARTFANDGCWEILIPGKTIFAYRPFDTLLLLQQALGVTDPEAPVPDYATFDDLYAAFKERLAAHILQHHKDADSFAAWGIPATLISLFVQDCIERGRGYYDRGARYNVCAPHAGGLPDVANALLVTKKLVYEDHELALRELVEILRRNWEGHEPLRQRIRSRFKFYGNGDAEADAMVRKVFDDYVALVGEVRERNGVLRPAGLSTFGRQIEYAAHRGATAAGTRRGDVLASNFSPAPGTDAAGPTAVLRSCCSVDFEKLPNGTALELKVHPASVKGEEGVDALVALLKAFVEMGGVFLHVDVVDSETLRDAQAHPGKYPNMAVRIAGWSARFDTLGRQWQDMVIERTQQEFR